MKNIIFTIKLLLYAYLAYLVYFLAADYDPTSSAFRPPFLLWITDWMNLYMHEAGHLLFKIFGWWMYFLGGSLIQILLPLSLVMIIARQRNWYIGTAGFWMGENMVNVSIYIKDAPFRKLHLIGKGLVHDWNWLLSNNLDVAESLGDIVFIVGIILCAASIGAGIILAVRDYRWHEAPLFPE
jgi:hypothetical protein